jgi:hypothetical protein
MSYSDSVPRQACTSPLLNSQTGLLDAYDQSETVHLSF